MKKILIILVSILALISIYSRITDRNHEYQMLFSSGVLIGCIYRGYKLYKSKNG